MTVGERIKKRREELQMTQEEMAKKMGYKSRSSVNKMEVSRELTLKTIRKLANVLECSESYLMGWEEEKEDIEKSAKTDFEIIEIYNRLSNKNKIVIKKMIETLIEQEESEE